MNFLITCKPDFEKILAREIALDGLALKTQGKGWVLAQGDDAAHPDEFLSDLCFAQYILENPVEISATSVNSLAEKLVETFVTHIGSARIVEPWPFLFFSSGDEQLIHHAGTVQERWTEKLRKKMSRVARLAMEGIPSGAQFAEGFFVQFTDFNKTQVAFRAMSQGQQRMKMDPQAPSRSYLKIEESFHVFGCEPQENETVVDLGAAPGGWSWGALKRGAFVTAVDNGPLREPVRSHSKMTHLEADALKYRPDEGKTVDWLLCDVLEQPDIILDILQKWLSQRWCRRFVVNLKVGRLDPIMVLKRIRDPKNGLPQYCRSLASRQLYHDREEITLMGQVKE
jgi:23S rRNA (cytidine2498-2'-O)-methyltransferase